MCSSEAWDWISPSLSLPLGLALLSGREAGRWGRDQWAGLRKGGIVRCNDDPSIWDRKLALVERARNLVEVGLKLLRQVLGIRLVPAISMARGSGSSCRHIVVSFVDVEYVWREARSRNEKNLLDCWPGACFSSLLG